MRSRADSAWTVRRAIESVLHAAAITLTGSALLLSACPAERGTNAFARTATLDAALRRWSAGDQRAVRVELDRLPTPTERDWLAAIDRAGTRVTWGFESDTPRIVPYAFEAQPRRDPRSGTDLWMSAPAAEHLRLRDALGESVVHTRGTLAVSAVIDSGIPSVTARVDGQPMTVPRCASRSARAVGLLSRASWEGKFTAAALEELGWKVRATFRLSPASDQAAQRQLGDIDTSRYALVIALDSSASDLAPVVARFVRQGGGLILLSDAVRQTALRELAAAAVGAPRPARETIAGDTNALAALAFTPFVTLRADALILDERDGAVRVAARRAELGRVIQVGYEDVWRWRMRGEGDPVAAHREWWGALAAAAASVPPRPRQSRDDHDDCETPGRRSAAPWAETVAALGPPAPVFAPRSDERRDRRPLLLGFAALALLVEWASRRLGGLR